MDDPIEKIVERALNKAGINFVRPANGLDFECDGVAIECKQFFTERLLGQIRNRSDVIVIQGRDAALKFEEMVGRQ